MVGFFSRGQKKKNCCQNKIADLKKKLNFSFLRRTRHSRKILKTVLKTKLKTHAFEKVDKITDPYKK
jgi:hypothetical protein